MSVLYSAIVLYFLSKPSLTPAALKAFLIKALPAGATPVTFPSTTLNI